MKSKKKLRKAHKRKLRNLPKSFCLVYGLSGPDGKIRYIGQTRQRAEDRLDWYYKDVTNPKKRTQPVQRWFESLLQQGIEPQMLVIDENATWDVSEIIYIERYRAAGHDLMNVTRGGIDGIGNVKREQRIVKRNVTVTAL